MRSRWLPRLPLALLVLLCLAGEGRADDRDDFQRLCDRALALYRAGQYEEAIQAFDAAYALREHPALLFNLGKAHMRLGNARKALGYYEFYLRVEPHPRPDVRVELDRYIAQARALIQAAEKAKERARQAEKDTAAERARKPVPPLDLAAVGRAPPPPLSLVALGPPPPAAARPPLHQRWWLWTAVGGVAAGAALTAVLVAQPFRPRVPGELIDLRDPQ